MMADRKLSFTKRVLTHPELGTVPRSMPLIIPNDSSYDVSTNELKPIEGERRTSLKIVPETLRLLETIERPIAVLAIGGPCRTGKSYILSRALGSADDFALGHTFNAKTFGIWIGTTVLEGEDFTVLMMDTEGIDSTNAKARDDASILVMTVLLSSYFIYNSLGVPHHSDLEKMSYFANLATSIIVKNATDDDDGSLFDFKKYFPQFLWLLRDVHLLPTNADGKEISPTEYLVSTVLRRGKSFKETKNDEVGRAILTFFPSIECKTIRAPSSKPEVVRAIAEQQSKLDPVFNTEVESLVSEVLRQLQPKRGMMACNLVDGPMLATMTTHYLKAVNDPDAIPCITDTWNAALEKRCKDVLDELITEYEKELETHITQIGLPMEEDSPDFMDMAQPRTLFGIHRSVLLKKTESLIKQVGHYVGGPLGRVSTSLFSRESLSAEFELRAAVFKEEDTATDVDGKLIKRKKVAGGILYRFSQRNYTVSHSSSLALFEKLYQPIGTKIQNDIGGYSFEELLEDLKKLQLDYFGSAVGPAKWEVFKEKRGFIKAQEEAYSVLKGFQRQAFDAAQKAADESTKAAQLADMINKLELQMRNDAELNQKRMESMQSQHEEEMVRLREEEADRIEKDRQKYENFVNAHMQDMAQMTEENKEEMREQYDRMLKVMEATSKQNSEQISALTKTVDQMTTKVANMNTGGNGGDGWLGTLVTVAGKVMETAITAKACSIM